MSFLNNLPTELISNVCTSLDTADIAALRYSDRKLAMSKTDAFLGSFTSIEVSCSDAGLSRLEAIYIQPSYRRVQTKDSPIAQARRHSYLYI
jgi:hypothetical protein